MNPKFLLLFAALLSFRAIADTPTVPLPGFLGIPWGASMDDAKKQFTSRSHAHYIHAQSNDHELAFDGGKFAGFKLHSAKLSFKSGQFFVADCHVEATSKKHEKEFAALKNMLTEKYGKPGRDDQVGDGVEANWYFPVPGQPANNLGIVQNPNGDSIHVFYLSESTKGKAQAAAGPVAPEPAKPAKTAKPSATAAGDKDDL